MRKSESKNLGQYALEFGVDGENQCSKLGRDIGVLIEFFQFGLSHCDSDIEFLALVNQPDYAGLLGQSANVSWDKGDIH